MLYTVLSFKVEVRMEEGGGALFVYKLNISFMIVYCVGRYKDEQGLFCNISVGFISL